MNSPILFHTDLLILRSLAKTDFDLVFKWENDPENWIQSGIVKPYLKQEILDYVSKPEDLLVDGQVRFMIDLKNRQTVGCIDLFGYSPTKNMASVGLLISPDQRRKGYGNEALEGLEALAISLYNLKALKALILSDNKYSMKLFENNGFIRDLSKKSIYTYKNNQYEQFTYFKEL